MHLSTKKYGHEEGLSCAFRQWRAESHCNQLHGYALSFEFTFACEELDHRKWCADFGDFKELRRLLHEYFDHTTVVARDDPAMSLLKTLDMEGVITLVVLPNVGCESFAEFAWQLAHDLVMRQYDGRVKVVKCTVAEHGSNSASYVPTNVQF